MWYQTSKAVAVQREITSQGITPRLRKVVCASVIPGSRRKETKGLFRDDRSLISALYVAFHDDSRSLSNFHFRTEGVGNDDRGWLCIYIGE